MNLTYNTIFRGGTGCDLTWGGEAGEEGAVLAPEEVLLEDTFGVEELPELVVEGVEPPESVVAAVGWEIWWGMTWCWTILVWSVGIRGVLSSNVGVGGATREGPGWTLYYFFKEKHLIYLVLINKWKHLVSNEEWALFYLNNTEIMSISSMKDFNTFLLN